MTNDERAEAWLYGPATIQDAYNLAAEFSEVRAEGFKAGQREMRGRLMRLREALETALGTLVRQVETSDEKAGVAPCQHPVTLDPLR